MTTTNILGAFAITAIIGFTVLVSLACYLVSLILKGRRQREEAREVRRRLADVVELAADWVWETDAEHRFVYLSERFGQISGRDPAIFLGVKQTELPEFLGREIPGWPEHLQTLAARQPFHGFRYQGVDVDGNERTYSVSGKPIFDEAGRFRGYRGTGSDLTETAKAHAVADAAEERARLVLDSALDAFVSITPDGRVVDWNAAAETTLGYTRQQAQGRRLIDLIVPDSLCDLHLDMLERLRTGRPGFLDRRVRTTALRRDGQEFPCELTVTQTQTPSGLIFNAFMRDITEQERYQNEMERARMDAEVASRAKSEFLAAMSHELRTPLNAVIGFADLLVSNPDVDPDRRAEYLDDIRSSGAHLLDLINDVLDLSKVEAGRLVLHDELLDVGETCESCLRLMSERAKNAGVDLRMEVPDSLPPVAADVRRIKQILINLLTNAVKFSYPGGAVTLAARLDAGDDLCLSVADGGVGMEQADVAKALEPFSQLDSGYNRQSEGTGLGLALVKRLAEAHDGRIEIDTAPGAGTTVTVRLPGDRVHRPTGGSGDAQVVQLAAAR